MAKTSISRVSIRRGDDLIEIVEQPVWSADNPAPVRIGPGYSERLRRDGWHKARRYPHARNGREIAVKFRWEKPGEPRQFTSYRVHHDEPVPLLLSDELEKIIARGQRVWLTESHSDVEALLEAGAFATTNWGSASEWNEHYAEQLRASRVVIVRHRDPAGLAFADKVAWSLLNRTWSIRVVEPYRGKDARDHLEAGYSLEEFVEAS